MDDKQIIDKGGTERDIAQYAHDVGGACGAIYGGTCNICGKRDESNNNNYTNQGSTKK